LILGGVDKSMFAGDINWFKYTTYKFYSINIKYMSIGNVKISSKIKAVVDTKFEHILVDSFIIDQIKREIQSALCRNNSKYSLNEGL